MKHNIFKIFLITISLVCISVIAFICIADETVDTMQKNKQLYLNVAGIKYPVIIESKDGYSSNFIDEMIADIELLYSRFKKHEILEYSSKKKFVIKENVISSKAFITFKFRPDLIQDNPIYVAESEDTDHLVLTKELILGYEKAIKFKESHVEEFNKLYEFINFVNNLGDNPSLDDLLSLYYFGFEPGLKNKAITELKNKFNNKNPLKRFNFLKPSILEVFISNEDLFKGFLMYETVCFDKKINKVCRIFPLMYIDSKWQIIVVMPGT